ncbi:MAG: N-acetyl-gamma-glutamyl-phosphate reductase [Nitrospinales bacterium]
MANRVKASIAGASGYTGLELVRLLARHPAVELVTLTSETYAGRRISDVAPSLKGWADHELAPLSPDIADSCDILFLALPHTAAMADVPVFLEHSCKVIDLSADFRLHDAGVFEEWYHTPHQTPDHLARAVYGLPELHRDEIRSASLVANPGCYPTSVILALAPLMNADWVDSGSIVADSKSGVSGAGRKASQSTQFAECNEGLSAYNLAGHRHTPEIEQELSALAKREIRLTFSPHLVPMTRGLLSTVYVNMVQDVALDDLAGRYREFYKNEPFVRILDPGKYANTHFVAHSNYCDIGLQVDTRNRRIIITSAIDNLMKGASGQAVQNLNIMLGIDETTALDFPGIFP